VFSNGGKRSLIGLDITTSSVKLIELAESGRSYRVESFAAEATPPNAINEKAIVDADAVGEAIRRAIKRSGTKAREAAIASISPTREVRKPSRIRKGAFIGKVAFYALALPQTFVHSPARWANPPKVGDAKPPV
jgi:type IV pilus assembly protein PilM